MGVQCIYIVISYTMINGSTLWLTGDFFTTSSWTALSQVKPYLIHTRRPLMKKFHRMLSDSCRKRKVEKCGTTWPRRSSIKFNEPFFEVQHLYLRFVDIFDKHIMEWPILFVAFATERMGTLLTKTETSAWCLIGLDLYPWYSELPKIQKLPELLMLWEA